MNSQSDRAVDQLVEQALEHALETFLQLPGPVILVIFSGRNQISFQHSCRCLKALRLVGYRFLISFSFTARGLLPEAGAVLSTVAGIRGKDILILDDFIPALRFCSRIDSLFVPCISENSLAKAALGLRDNPLCQWLYRALLEQRPVHLTYLPEAPELPWQPRSLDYLRTLKQLGVCVLSDTDTRADQHEYHSGLLSLAAVRRCQPGTGLILRPGCLVTAAARDEARSRHIQLTEQSRRKTDVSG